MSRSLTSLRRAVAGWPGRLLMLAIGFRVVFPLAVLAASPGRLLPGLPHYRYNPLEGDAYGYYFGARELLDVWRRDAVVLLPSALVLAAVVFFAWRRLSGATRVAVVVWAAGLLAALLCAFARVTGAPQIGWSLAWSFALLPYRAVGLPLDPGIAFDFGLALSLLCNAITVIATYRLAQLAGLRRNTAVAAASLIAYWPLLSLLTGHNAASNGTWQIDLGLSLYTEPLSTALVIVGLVLVLERVQGNLLAALGGGLLGLSVLVRLSNALIAVVVVVLLLVWRDRRRALAVALTGLAFAPAVALYYPKGYPTLKPRVFPSHPFRLSYAEVAWSHSLLWHPAVLIAIVPIAVVGALRLRDRVAVLMCLSVALTAGFYTFYKFTPLHPRFLFVVLPLVAILWVAGVTAIATNIPGLYHRER